MKTKIAWNMIVVCIACAGCATMFPTPGLPEQPESPVRALCEAGRYHEAMRALPEAMRQWEAYTKCTGETAEGTAGLEYFTTLSAVAEKGDADWGRILDDTKIPYEYKVEMVFEILEARLGEGSVYVANKDNLIVPRKRPADLEHEMISLPEK